MKLDPKLLRRLAERGDANEVLAEALGVCPTCGQPTKGPRLPTAGEPRRSAKERRTRGTLKAAIIEYLTHTDTRYGNQSRCARALGVQHTYVNKVWGDHQRTTPKNGTGKREAIIAWMAEHPDGTQAECARVVGCTRAYVSSVWVRARETNEEGKGDGQGGIGIVRGSERPVG